MKTTRSLFLAGFALLSLIAGDASAQAAYPNRPVHLVIPFPPGGSNDVIGRVLAQQLSTQMGEQVVVDNKGGADGGIASDFVSHAAPDGYTALLNSSSIVLNQAVHGSKGSRDPLKDFTPVSLVSSVPMVLMTHPSMPVNNVREFVAHLKANPGKVSYASAGTGNITHLGIVLLLQANKLSAVHIPYKGAGPALVDTMAGHTQFTMATVATAEPIFKDRRLKVLAITSLQRSPLIPDAPTLAETIMPGFEIGTWQGVLFPAGVAQDIVKRMNLEVNAAMKSSEVQKRLAAAGANPLFSTSEEYSAYLKKELERYTKVVKEADIKPE